MKVRLTFQLPWRFTVRVAVPGQRPALIDVHESTPRRARESARKVQADLNRRGGA